jgi:glycosyltransferase involved in cell wall biosynthesis
MPSERVLLAGAAPGMAAGNSVSTATLYAALTAQHHVDLLTHEISAYPRLRRGRAADVRTLVLGVQPLSVHGESALAGRLHARAIREYSCGWAVNSRYAGALHAAGIPYVIWEPTTLRDELAVIDQAAVRRSGRGSGLGTALHKAILPFDEWLEHRLYMGATAVLAMSEYTRDRIQAIHGLGPSRLRILPHPPSPNFMAALHGASGRAAGRDQFADDSLRLLFVGRVDDPRKNFALLCDALMTLRSSGNSVTLTVAGPYSEQWRRRLRRDVAAGIRFMGRISEEQLVEAFREHDMLVVSSRQEGFGIVVAEALHAGLPVVSTRCGGPEQVIRESESGVLVDHSVGAIVAAIRDLARDPARRFAMGERGMHYARRELSTERFCERVDAEVTRLIAERMVAAPGHA